MAQDRYGRYIHISALDSIWMFGTTSGVRKWLLKQVGNYNVCTAVLVEKAIPGDLACRRGLGR